MNISAFLEPVVSRIAEVPSKRWHIHLGPACESGVASAVGIMAISPDGFLFRSSARLAAGDVVTLSLPDRKGFKAFIGWANEPLYSCRFVQRLSQADIDLIGSFSMQQGPAGALGDQETVDLPESLSVRLRRLRREHGLSLKEMAQRLDVSAPTIWSWETGRTVPRSPNMQLIARMFSVPEQQLRYGSRPTAGNMIEQPVTAQSSSLETIVTKCRAQIAEAAGVEASQVHIHIVL